MGGEIRELGPDESLLGLKRGMVIDMGGYDLEVPGYPVPMPVILRSKDGSKPYVEWDQKNKLRGRVVPK